MGTTKLLLCLVLCVILNVVYSNRRRYVSPRVLEELYARKRYDEFARLLNIPNVSLVIPAENSNAGDANDREDVCGADSLPKPWDQRDPGGESTEEYDYYEDVVGDISPKYDSLKWKSRVVPYVIGNSYDSGQKQRILNAIDDWNKNLRGVCIFRPHDSEKDYVLMFNGNGCYSFIGKQGGQQGLSLGVRGCLNQGTIQHEMMHAIGFIHEHQRQDRDVYIRMIPTNIPNQWKSQYEMVPDDFRQTIGDYDYHSCMHYPILAPGTDLPAFRILRRGVDESRVGQREGQTEMDIKKIKEFYK